MTQQEPTTQENTLAASIHNDRLYFDQVLQMIPAAHYFSGSDQAAKWASGNKYGKWKKDRPDKKNSIKQKQKNKRKETSNSNDENPVTGKQKQKNKTEIKNDTNSVTLGKRGRSTLDDDAKERLRQKIQALREKRKVSDEPKAKKQKTNEKNEEKRNDVIEKVIQDAVSQEISSDVEDLNFGTFDYSDGKAKPAYLNIKKNQKVTYSLLQKVEGEKKKHQELKKTKEGKVLVQEKKMEIALRKVQGEKIKDDPSKIRKTLKRKERQVEKSKQKAADRKRTEKLQQAKKIRQREDNIRNRADTKKANKGKRGKPEQRAGFEGKKKGFINK